MTDSKLLRVLGAAALLVTASACSDLRNCPADAKDPIVIDTGLTDQTAVTYQSAPWGGPLDHFPAKTKLRFEHELGVIPLNVNVYLAFDSSGTNDAGPGSVAASAGNQSLIDCVDAHVIEIKNDTCEDSFYILVAASDPAPTDPKAPDRSNACTPQ